MLDEKTEAFRVYLKDELLRRCRENQVYSLRAFAKYLHIDPSTLSQIIRKKRDLSHKTMETLAERLGVDPENQIVVGSRESIVPTPANLEVDNIRMIADWYHLPIVQYLRLDVGAKNDEGIAKAFRINIHEARAALERLERLELVERDEKGNYSPLKEWTTSVHHKGTHAALRQAQRQILKKAELALDEVEFEKRSQSSICMAVDPERLEEAGEMIKGFRRKLAAFLSGGKRSEVYQLSISLFPLTNMNQEEN